MNPIALLDRNNVKALIAGIERLKAENAELTAPAWEAMFELGERSDAGREYDALCRKAARSLGRCFQRKGRLETHPDNGRVFGVTAAKWAEIREPAEAERRRQEAMKAQWEIGHGGT